MSNLLRSICIPVLGLCVALPAQGEGEKPKPQEPVKVKAPAPSKEADTTSNDPAIKAVDKFIDSKNVDKKDPDWRTKLSMPPTLPFDVNSDYFWHIETEFGPITIRYYPDTAPIHVSSGVYLARLGYYDGLGFHRVIPGFMAQGGCPNTSDPAKQRQWGQGGPGYKFPGELAGGRSHNKPGMLSMANAGPGTDGSQFFITFAQQTGLDSGYTIWGEVTEGMDTVKKLESKGVRDNNGMLPAVLKITKTWISVAPKAKAAEKPKAEEKPKEGEKK